jgi:predicted MFS family arabinose efflux permease
MTDPDRPQGAARIAVMFGAFAFSYFFSALLRAVVATLAPVFSAELDLGAGELGLLAGAYFLGFAAMQLPLGAALDRYGSRRVLLTMMTVAVAGCVAFASGKTFTQLIVARLLIGIGVAASLMAPLTAFVRLVTPSLQLRLNSWMLMTGSLGMLASTVPVQQLLPLTGWRGLFWLIAGLMVVAMAGIAWTTPGATGKRISPVERVDYLYIVRHPAFVRAMPLGFFTYGGMIALQALWAGPWMTQVGGRSPAEAAQGLFFINLSMLVSFLCWGAAMPRLVRIGFGADKLIAWGWPIGVLVMGVGLGLGPSAGAAWWALWCVSSSVVSLSQPAIAQAFPSARAGRALSAFNLVIFMGVFVNQWGIGLVIDALSRAGWSQVACFRAAFGLFLAGMLGSGLWFWRAPRTASAIVAETHR